MCIVRKYQSWQNTSPTNICSCNISKGIEDKRVPGVNCDNLQGDGGIILSFQPVSTSPNNDRLSLWGKKGEWWSHCKYAPNTDQSDVKIIVSNFYMFCGSIVKFYMLCGSMKENNKKKKEKLGIWKTRRKYMFRRNKWNPWNRDLTMKEKGRKGVRSLM